MAPGRGRGGRGRGPNRPQTVRNPQKRHDWDRGPKGRGKGKSRGRGDARSQSLAATVFAPKVETEVREEAMLRHDHAIRAHDGPINAIVTADDAIYTVSTDKYLKRWKPVRNATGRFELKNDHSIDLGRGCSSLMYVGEWLFCGLESGVIRGFSKTAGSCDLNGHNKRVSALIVHEHVMISGSADRTIRCWQAGQSGLFSSTHVVDEDMPGSILCLCVVGDFLWLGTTSGVALVDLKTLKVTSNLMPKKMVSGFVPYQGTAIVAYQDGSIIIYDDRGVQKHSQPPLPGGPLHCIGGLTAGPRVLCGHGKGQVSSIILPSFDLKKYWQAFERCKVSAMCCSMDGMFMLGGENGDLHLWQRDESGADL